LERSRTCQRLLYEAGFAGIAWPTEFGGQGLSIKEQIAFNAEAVGYELPLGPFTVGLGMCGPTLLAVGTAEQRNRYLEPMLRGEEIWCQLFSEPGAGSDVASVSTRARRDGDEWVIDGQKTWTTGAHYARYGLAIVRTDPEAAKHRGLTMFVVDLDATGVTVRPIRQMDGRAIFNDVFLDGVRVSDDSVVGDVNEGWKASLSTLMNERVAIGVTRIGDDAPSAAALIAAASAIVGPPDPVLRDELMQLYEHERIAEWVGSRVTSALLSGRAPGPEGSIAKLLATAVAKRAAALGGRVGQMSAQAWPADDPRATRWAGPLLHVPQLSIAGGTDEVQRNVIAERVLGLPKEPAMAVTARDARPAS
jgi:alkylation response protein AidB-like acyl-CoA dehydrogenase